MIIRSASPRGRHIRTGHNRFASTRSRRAVSLVELVVVISVSSVMISMCGITLHLLMRGERMTAKNAVHSASVVRFTRQFRDDVRAATHGALVEQDDGSHQLVLSVPDTDSVVYGAVDGSIERNVQRDGAVDHHDVFHLAPASRITFKLTDDGTLARAVIEHGAPVPGRGTGVEQRDADGGGQRQWLEIHAAIGRDHRRIGGESREEAESE